MSRQATVEKAREMLDELAHWRNALRGTKAFDATWEFETALRRAIDELPSEQTAQQTVADWEAWLSEILADHTKKRAKTKRLETPEQEQEAVEEARLGQEMIAAFGGIESAGIWLEAQKRGLLEFDQEEARAARREHASAVRGRKRAMRKAVKRGNR